MDGVGRKLRDASLATVAAAGTKPFSTDFLKSFARGEDRLATNEFWQRMRGVESLAEVRVHIFEVLTQLREAGLIDYVVFGVHPLTKGGVLTPEIRRRNDARQLERTRRLADAVQVMFPKRKVFALSAATILGPFDTAVFTRISPETLGLIIPPGLRPIIPPTPSHLRQEHLDMLLPSPTVEPRIIEATSPTQREWVAHWNAVLESAVERNGLQFPLIDAVGLMGRWRASSGSLAELEKATELHRTVIDTYNFPPIAGVRHEIRMD